MAATHSSDNWQYVAGSGDTVLSGTSRAIRIGGVGHLYAHVGDSSTPTMVVSGALVGEVINIRTKRIGAGTTCTKMTVYLD